MCVGLFLYLTSFMFKPEFAICLIEPTTMVALNVLLIWFTIFAPAGVLMTLIFFLILCCPMITYQVYKEEHQAR
jgi:predicted membrane protein